jgi:DnaA family protein
MRQLILDLLPEAPPRLDNFVAGGNVEALTGLAAWLAPDSDEPSLFLWGESGSGKTHLLRASEARYSDAAVDPDLATLGEIGDFHAVDNVDALSETGQIELFNLFNRLRASGGRLLTAASQPPLQLALREDLRTRLGSGLIYRLHVLTDGEKIDALSTQAVARGLRLPPDALDYLLARAPRDMRSLAAVIAALDRYSLEHKRSITLPLLRDVLQATLN